MKLQEIIKYEGDNETLVYKHPAEDFNTMSQLIVHESQEAVFYSDGQALDTFKTGRYTLETKNIPLLSKLRNIISDGVSPFHTEVYFINLTTLMDINWGTPNKFTVKDPNYGYSYEAGANGSFGLKIIDGRNLLINLIGTENAMTTSTVQRYFKDLIITKVKSSMAVELSKYSYNEINQHLDDISKELGEKIQSSILSYGIQVINFFVSVISIKEEDLDKLKSLDNEMAQKRYAALGDRDAAIIGADAAAKAREIQGYTWQQEQQFDVGKLFAANEGFASNPANMMAQIPLAFTMANMMKNNVVQGMEAQPVSPAAIACPKCGQKLTPEARFCHQCGEKIEHMAVHYCTKCGCRMPEGAGFCPNCGGKVE